MATSKPPYDPIKTVEGMFMGSVTRIAYAMRDPTNYAQSTKAVLTETAKKFQDALDDCEIQILDAKWYLENQLALNKARREAKAREESAASMKRKRDEGQESQDPAQSAEGEHPSKRPKTADPESQPPAQQKAQKTSPTQKSALQPQPQPQPAAETRKPTPQPTPRAAETPPVVQPPEKPEATSDVKPAPPPAVPAAKPQDKPPEAVNKAKPVQPPERTMTQTTTDDFPRPTPQDTPADGNEEFNFESMFGEPSADLVDAAGPSPAFDFNALENDPFGGGDTSMHVNPELLPGLESYANQAGDDSTFNLSGSTLVNGMPPDSNTTNDVTNSGPPTQQISNTDDFGLPALGPNEFDDFLNDPDMNFDGNMNMDGGGDMLNMDNIGNMDSLDFDSMFS